jgi:hypothetical protein
VFCYIHCHCNAVKGFCSLCDNNYECVCHNRCHGMLLRDFWAYRIIYMNVCCYSRRHGNAVNGFLTLWDNTLECVLL